LDAFQRFERLALEIHWAARLCGNPRVGLSNDDGKPLLGGKPWENLVHKICGATAHTRIQGPGKKTLFERRGASGLLVEFDVAIDYGRDAGLMVLIEAKGHMDGAKGLPRDIAFVLTGKLRDHLAGDHFSWRHAHLLFASSGRLPPSVCRWSFYEGIDVTDPDRFPLSVLSRLDILLPDVSDRLANSDARATLFEILDRGKLDPEEGPVLLKHRDAKPRAFQGKKILYDLERAQRTLSDEVVAALCDTDEDQYDAEAQESLLAIHRRALEAKGISVPSRSPRAEELPLGG
jgi:hypothetical protein